MAKTVFITGANRGFGLEFIRQYLKLDQPPQVIIATCYSGNSNRKYLCNSIFGNCPNDLFWYQQDLKQLAESNPSVNIYKLDISDFNSLPSLANKVDEIVGDLGLDVLINNASALIRVSLLVGSPHDMIKSYKVNTVGPFMITRTLLPHLQKARTRNSAYRPIVVNITSLMGSIDDNTTGGRYAYRSSKAALNMVTKSISVDLEPSGIKAVAIHPGWVRTVMGGPNAVIETDESVTNMIRVIGDVQTGKNKSLFLNYDGDEIKW